MQLNYIVNIINAYSREYFIVFVNLFHYFFDVFSYFFSFFLHAIR